jgi:hypothetical protein
VRGRGVEEPDLEFELFELALYRRLSTWELFRSERSALGELVSAGCAED